MAELFGFEFKRKSKEDTSQLPSFSQKETDDGAVVIAAGGSFGTYVDLDGTVRTEAELVTKYREMSLHPECDSAVEEIVNESISIDEEDVININLEDLKVSENIKNAIKTEFQTCLQLLDFKRHAYDIYRRWYVDGRLYYHAVIDENSPKEGIKDVRYIDPRKIRKVREITRKRIQHGNPMDAVTTKTVNEYFIFNDKGFNYGNKVTGPTTAGLKIAKDSIVHVTSGLTDNQGTMVLSYLHKAIKALNQLRTLEDSLVIYRLARAPERRIWYIDVGNLPKMKAEQYFRDIMVKHKNRLIYDAQSGEIRDDRKFMTMLEDYWLPRREGGRGTEVTTLPGGQTLGQMDDVLYFQKKFLQTLNVPVSRLNSDAVFSIGRATEITRDELKFARFIIRLRTKFSDLFIKMLEKQLVLKGIMTLEDWEQIRQDIKFDYARDNYFTELKNAEIYNNRLSLAGSYQNFTGKYYSHEWVRRNILRQTDDDMKTMDSQIQKEKSSDDPRWINPAIDQNLQMELQTQSMVQQNQQMAQQNAQPQQQGGAPIDPNVGATQDPQMQQKMQEIRNAKMIVDKLKGTTPAGRSIQDQSKYKAAVQILAKNRDLAAQLGMTQ